MRSANRSQTAAPTTFGCSKAAKLLRKLRESAAKRLCRFPASGRLGGGNAQKHPISKFFSSGPQLLGLIGRVFRVGKSLRFKGKLFGFFWLTVLLVVNL